MGTSSNVKAQELWRKVLDWIKERSVKEVHVNLSRGRSVKCEAWSYGRHELVIRAGRARSRVTEGEAHVYVKAPVKYLRELSGIIIDFMRGEGRKYSLISLSAPLNVIRRYVPSPNIYRYSLEDSLEMVKEIIKDSIADAVALHLTTSMYGGGVIGTEEYVFTDGRVSISEVTMFSGVKARHDVSFSIDVNDSTWSIVIDELFGTDETITQPIHISAPRALWDPIINGIKEALGNRELFIINEDEELRDKEEENPELDEWDEEDEPGNDFFTIGLN